MSVNPENRRLPLSHVFVDVVLPAHNTRVALVNGVPGSGVEVGALGGPPEITIQRSTKAFESETHNVPLAHDPDTRGMMLKFSMKEITGINFQRAAGGVLIVEGDGSKSIRIGSGNALESRSWMITWETRPGSGVYEAAMIFNGVVNGDVALKLSRGDYTEISVEIVAQPVLTRPVDDDLGYATIL